MREWLCFKYEIHKGKPKDLYFRKEIFIGLTFSGTYIRTFEFLNVKIEQRISQEIMSYYS